MRSLLTDEFLIVVTHMNSIKIFFKIKIKIKISGVFHG